MRKIKQKGYALLMTMALSVLVLSFTVLHFENVSNEISKETENSFITKNAKSIIDFSTAVSKVMIGVGAIPGQVIEVAHLKNLKLLNDGFSNNIAFNQTVKAYYVTSPTNQNVIDVLITISGLPSKEIMQKYGVSENTLKVFYLDVLKKSEEMGFPASDDSEEFHIGIIPTGGRKLETLKGDVIDITHVNTSNQETTLGIYAKAPNQVGWWRMQVGPNLVQSVPHMRHVSRSDGITLQAFMSGIGPISFFNDGFSYYCPEQYKKVLFGEEFSIQEKDLITNNKRSYYFCIQTYKGSVNPELVDRPSVQLFNPIDSSSPEPAKSKPELWGRCMIAGAYYDRSEFKLDTRCVDDTHLKIMTNENLISGLNNNIEFDTWKEVQSNTTYKNMYNLSFKDKYDFKVPNAIFANGMIHKLDNRYIRTYHLTGTFMTGGSNGDIYDSSKHKFNKISTYGIEIKNSMPSIDSVTIPFSYQDAFGNNKIFNVTIPTPIIK